jgi:thiamine biosynthesis lipoprotein
MTTRMDALVRTERWFGFVLIAGIVVSACDSGPRLARIVERSQVVMGSTLTVAAWTDDESAALSAFEAVFAEFDRLDGRLSVWTAGSDVVRLNAAAGARPVPIGDDLRTVLAAAAEAYATTDGAFDITFGALAEVWKFDHDQDNRVPTRADIDARRPLIDFRAVTVDRPPGTAFIERPGVRIHLGGIGKGYAVDRAAGILRRLGISNFMIQSGGDLYVGGLRDGHRWRLGIQDPRGDAGDSFASLDLTDRTLSTSGDYERFFVKDGVRYHHLIDTRTGEPARLCRSVSIVAKTALQADWLSTGVFVLGPERGLALVEKLPDVEVVIVTADNRVVVSSGLRQRVTLRHPPTEGM